MSDIFRTIGKLWIANITAGVAAVVGFVGWPVLLGIVESLPMVPSLGGLWGLSMYAGVALAAIAWVKVMVK
jgi:hypothetical protein